MDDRYAADLYGAGADSLEPDREQFLGGHSSYTELLMEGYDSTVDYLLSGDDGGDQRYGQRRESLPSYGSEAEPVSYDAGPTIILMVYRGCPNRTTGNKPRKTGC